MRTRTLFLTTALAVSLVGLGACNKTGGAANNAADSANNAAATSSPVVAGAQDATSAVVGQTSAATTLTAAGFVTAAATSDMYEIAAAKIAMQKSTNPAIKKFAQQMVHDHSASTAKLKGLLAQPGMTATPPTDMDERRKGMLNNLTMAKPADFDKLYIDQQVAAHDEALTLFKGYADHGDNDALKGFAASTTPVIQSHRDMAKQIESTLK
ncbi:MAG TPA: DUF4142 domain-containing protein [Caulobacteraceae bacterium]